MAELNTLSEVQAERERTKTLARWISTALTTLEGIDPDDMEHGGANMDSLIADGITLVKAVFLNLPIAKPLSECARTVPERIWLQVDINDAQQDQPFENDGVTWCAESVGGAEVEYIRSDLASKPSQAQDTERVERLKSDLRAIMIQYGAAERSADPERIRSTTSAGVALIDSLAPIARVEEKPVGRAPLTKAAQDVLSERRRQIEVEGWTPDHDDDHTFGELALAAAQLCVDGTDCRVDDIDGTPLVGWGIVEKHRADMRRQLVIAGALILAEIERRDRACITVKGCEA